MDVQARLKRLAESHGWKLYSNQPEISLLIFRKDSDFGIQQVNVYWSKMTVATTVNHPKGRKQLFRRHCTEKEIANIFKNPRIHTGKGYFTRRKSNGKA